MKWDDVVDTVNRIQYKPGWWPCVDIRNYAVEFNWGFSRPDAINGKAGIGFSGITYFPLEELTGPEHVVRLLFANALRCEEHEAREFFRYDKVRVFNPHQSLLMGEVTIGEYMGVKQNSPA